MNKPIKFKEYRTMDASTLRRVCIANNWYTNGTNEEYGNLFSRLRNCYGYAENLTTEKLVEIANDIWEHSEMPSDCTLETVLFELNRNCCTTFDVDE